MWFDVGIKRYTTQWQHGQTSAELWFDVGIKRYTTLGTMVRPVLLLWFDVGIKRYTTRVVLPHKREGCGLM